jgi:hypothetical protein
MTFDFERDGKKGCRCGGNSGSENIQHDLRIRKIEMKKLPLELSTKGERALTHSGRNNQFYL